MDKKVPKQDFFFYGGKWIREMDTLLLAHLIRLYTYRGWNLTNIRYDTLREVREVVNQLFGVQLTNGDIASRVELLKARYKTFKEVVATPGVRWEMRECKIEAGEQIWDRILQRNPNAGAYYYQDEPQFNFMVNLFGLGDVKVEKSEMREVINLSEDTEVVVVTDTVTRSTSKVDVFALSFSPADPDEVTPPAAGPSTRVKRKLFVEPKCGLDRFSANYGSGVCLPTEIELQSSSTRSSVTSWTPTHEASNGNF